MLTRYLAKKLGPRGIAVNTITPGVIAADFSGRAVRDNEQLNAFVASVLRRAPLDQELFARLRLRDSGPAVARR